MQRKLESRGKPKSIKSAETLPEAIRTKTLAIICNQRYPRNSMITIRKMYACRGTLNLGSKC
jgi:hypothetical protein